MESGIVLLIILGVAAAIVIGVLVAQAQKRAAEARRAALDEIATQEELDFYPDGLSEPPRGFLESLFTGFDETNLGKFLERFEGFSPFGQGHSYGVKNLLVGRREEGDWYAFDYIYYTTQSTGKTTTTTPHPTGVVAIRLPLALPDLTMSPENVFHRIGSALGMDELKFELEEFNRRYFIRSSDRKLAYDLLHPQMIEFLMAQEPRSWQLAGQFLVLTNSGYYTPEEIRATIDEIRGFINLIPRYVEQDHELPVVEATPLD